jgi:two-component system, LytTR family, sensor kinase
MNDTDSPENQTQRVALVRAKVHQLGDFYRNLMAFCVAMPVMLAVNFFMVPSSGYWSLLAIGIWGAILLMKAVRIFFLGVWFSADWEERKVRELLARKGDER